MSRGRHIAPKTRSDRISWGVLGLVLGLFLAMAIPAGAGVERYQFETTSYTVTYTVEGNDHPQYFTVTFNPCIGAFEGDGTQPVWGATWTEGSVDGTSMNYTTTYLDSPKPHGGTEYYVTVTATFDPNTRGFSGTWTDNYDTTGTVVGVAGTTTATSYNHGEYVAESIDEYGPDAHSCIGMPIVSNR